MLSAPERRQRARIGGLTRAARYDPHEVTAAARAANERSWLDQVDPDRTLPEVERERRAQAAKRAHFARLSLASIQARRRGAGVESLRLSGRLTGALLRAGLAKIRQLVKFSDEEFLAIAGVGPAGLGEIRAAIWRWENDSELPGAAE